MQFQDFISQHQDFFTALENFSKGNVSNVLFVAVVSITMLVLLRLKRRAKKRLQKIKANNETMQKPTNVITSQDLKAIAGDDVMTTQLDLARAYMEMDKKQLAKKILEHVVAHGNVIQQQEAHQLISSL